MGSEIEPFRASRNQKFSSPPTMAGAEIRQLGYILYIPEPGQYLALITYCIHLICIHINCIYIYIISDNIKRQQNFRKQI